MSAPILRQRAKGEAFLALPGDVFFTRSSSTLGRLIRWAETDTNEPNGAWANHVGVVVGAGWIGQKPLAAIMDYAKVVESLWHTELWPWYPSHEKESGNTIRVYRRHDLMTRLEDVRKIVDTATTFVGRRYGWWKLFAHLCDRLIFRGRKTISNALRVDKRPICSYTAAKSFAAGGVTFGMQPEAADPDEMMDYCETHPEEWFLAGELSIEGGAK